MPRCAEEHDQGQSLGVVGGQDVVEPVAVEVGDREYARSPAASFGWLSGRKGNGRSETAGCIAAQDGHFADDDTDARGSRPEPSTTPQEFDASPTFAATKDVAMTQTSAINRARRRGR